MSELKKEHIEINKFLKDLESYRKQSQSVIYQKESGILRRKNLAKTYPIF